MAKVALLIGASEYGEGLSPLPGAAKDVEAMQRVLQHREMGSFDEVKPLLNIDPQTMQEAIETLFSGRAKEDLVLLFFSGHGIKDESGRLYLATRITRKNKQGELVKATAVPASFVQDIMSNSRSKRQVIILDCCFSGAFAEGWLAKDDGSVDVKNQLGGEGRAVLTSSTSTQYSFEQQGSELSTYTRYLIEGIETGAADQTNDGVVSVDELHEYAKKKVQEAAPAMKPEIYAVREGFKIWLAKASTGDPKLRYRKEVELYASRGEISFVGRNTLDVLRDSLGLSLEDTAAIEADVLKPYQERNRKLQRYEQVLVEAIQRESSLSEYTRHDLKYLQQVLGLRNEDVAPIEARIASQKELIQSSNPFAESNEEQVLKPEQKRQQKLRLLMWGGAVAAAVIGLISFSTGSIFTTNSNHSSSDHSTNSDSFSNSVTYGQVTLSNFTLNGQSKPITVSPGEKINASVNYVYDCPECQSGSINQIIVGVGGENSKACIYNGGIKNSGSANFTLTAPNRPGTYRIHFRYAQAFGCDEALRNWWQVGGSTEIAENVIGSIKVK